MNQIGVSLGWNCHSAIWGVNNNIRKHKAEGQEEYQTYLKKLKLYSF